MHEQVIGTRTGQVLDLFLLSSFSLQRVWQVKELVSELRLPWYQATISSSRTNVKQSFRLRLKVLKTIFFLVFQVVWQNIEQFGAIYFKGVFSFCCCVVLFLLFCRMCQNLDTSFSLYSYNVIFSMMLGLTLPRMLFFNFNLHILFLIFMHFYVFLILLFSTIPFKKSYHEHTKNTQNKKKCLYLILKFIRHSKLLLKFKN